MCLSLLLVLNNRTFEDNQKIVPQQKTLVVEIATEVVVLKVHLSSNEANNTM